MPSVGVISLPIPGPGLLRVLILIVPQLFSEIPVSLCLDQIPVRGKAVPALSILVLALRLIIHTGRFVDAFSSGPASIYTGPVVVIRVQEGFFDLPVALLRADAEFKIFLGDAVPVLQRVSQGTIKGPKSLTLYTIMTPSKLQTVAKNSPSR